MTHLKVAVRVRPLSEREREANSVSVVAVEKNSITITNIKVPEQHAGDSRERTRRFAFDYCFDENATQDEVFTAVGTAVQNSIRKRYHSCVLAYGQSSSGKTHTMMGFSNDQGLTPKLCRNIFDYFRESATAEEMENMKTYVSYLEIYNEKVRDLLSENVIGDGSDFKTLKVREHPKKGPYVQGLSEHQVSDSAELLEWLQFGNRNRKVASTSNNLYSSRSHSVFTVTSCSGTKLHLIDLAGSERAGNRCWGSSRFKEGANINKSLVALGNVIYVLAEKSSRSRRFVPYRDSLLTWLLRDTLGGNSKTIMIATVSPSNLCYSETINTLRFGQRAKQVIIQPLVNEDPKEKTIRELRSEILRLKELLLQNQNLSTISKAAFSANESSLLPPEYLMENSAISNHTIQDQKQPETCDSPTPAAVINPNKRPSETKTEKLFPLINVKSSVKMDKSSLRRTFSASASEQVAEKEKPKFGSHEAIPSSGVKSTKRTSQPLLRGASIEKKSKPPLLKKTTEQKLPIKTERGTVTEVKGPKSEVVRRNSTVKPRAEIVAAVTQRLYARVKKKEATTETEDKKPSEEPPKELAICSNARFKLQELTRRALKAHKFKDIETQTDLFPVLRVKETSTDVDDLKQAIAEVKDVETEPIITETKSIGISCSLLEESFAEPHNNKQKNCLTMTRTCGTQSRDCSEDSKESDAIKPSVTLNNPLSFTKYLNNRLEPKIEILNPCTANPIYTTSVNINVSHNYGDGNRTCTTVLEDSLDEHSKHNNVCFPTPDLISNHNSLDLHTYAADEDSSTASDQKRIDDSIRYATTEIMKQEDFTSNVTMEPNKPMDICVANWCVAPSCCEKLQSINLHSVCAPECVVKTLAEDRCVPLAKSQPEPQKLTPENFVQDQLECVTLEEPVVLKSILKQNQILGDDEAIEIEITDSNSSVSHESENELPDSLNYHAANSKKVRFEKKKLVGSDRMFVAMSQFLEEATSLLSNLSLVANKIENNSTPKFPSPEDYDLHVTVNDISSLRKITRRHRKKRISTEEFGVQTFEPAFVDSYSQTTSKETSDACSLTENFEIPVNKFECLLEDSCDRLERCINANEIRRHHHPHVQNEFLHKFPQPFSANAEWNNFSNSTHFGDDSSMDSNPTLSDYGSLPRTKRRTHGCTPSAFLRQLASMREDVIRTSREELYKHANE